MVTLFQLFTLDQWYNIYLDVSKVMNPVAVLFYILVWIAIGSFVFRSLIIGIMGNYAYHVVVMQLVVEKTSPALCQYSGTVGVVCVVVLTMQPMIRFWQVGCLISRRATSRILAFMLIVANANVTTEIGWKHSKHFFLPMWLTIGRYIYSELIYVDILLFYSDQLSKFNNWVDTWERECR